MCAEILFRFLNMVNYKDECGRNFLTFIVYVTILLDNILLTVIVPILPDYLSQIDDEPVTSLQNSLKYKNLYMHYMSTMFGPTAAFNGTASNNSFAFDVTSDKLWTNNKLNDENSAVGILLAVKALVQLIMTPFVTSLINSFGYRIPTAFGTFMLFAASFTFAVGTNYFLLLVARAMQGVASACISVCGMSIIAQLYPEEKKRSQVLGIVLGSMALGVLLGYPFGGILYAFVGKSAPFFIIAFLTFVTLVLQLVYVDMQRATTEVNVENTNYSSLLSDVVIIKISGAIFISTIAMAILEPCLPIWLMANLKPEKWQIGTVFIPDSIGYFLSTNFLAGLAHKFGQIETAIFALIIVGISSLIIPHANSIILLVLPHFALGIGIGTLDVALVPMLASIVDTKYMSVDENVSGTSDSSYGAIYAIQQISVSMAYFVGPLLGGEIAQYIGFSWLMSLIGCANIGYALFLFISVFGFMYLQQRDEDAANNGNNIYLNLWPPSYNRHSSDYYKRFYNTMDNQQQQQQQP